MNHWRKITGILRILLLIILFTGYYGSNSFFFHTHVIEGKKVIHSHPFRQADKRLPKDSPETQHKHSQEELILIAFLNKVLLEDTGFPSLTRQASSVFSGTLSFPENPIRTSDRCFPFSLRAPPLA
ncbi:MAG TPA: hypothetical protein PLK12_15750 [Prolixibacteraceae bacterium]|nr:hypothetical protein [Prolixibacteraceae bacterium]